MMSDLCFNEESDSEENTSDNEDFHSTILQSFQFEPEQKKCMVMRAMTKKLNIFMLQLRIYDILDYKIPTGANADIAKTKQDYLSCREVDEMLIALAKIPEQKRSISSSSFYGQLRDC